MRCVAWFVLGGIGLSALAAGVLYVWGTIALRRQGFVFTDVPQIYDGRGPYETWAAKMQAARATQMKEEEK